MFDMGEIHAELLRRMADYRKSVDRGGGLYTPENFKDRLNVLLAFSAADKAILKAIANLPRERSSDLSTAAFEDYRYRSLNIHRLYNAKIARWSPDTIRSDPEGYRRATVSLHEAIVEHLAWERTGLAPLLRSDKSPP